MSTLFVWRPITIKMVDYDSEHTVTSNGLAKPGRTVGLPAQCVRTRRVFTYNSPGPNEIIILITESRSRAGGVAVLNLPLS